MFKNRKTKGLATLVVILLLLSIVMAGCSKKATNGEATASSTKASVTAAASALPSAVTQPTLAPVELNWYFDGTPQADVASVEAAINKIIQPKINATIKLNEINGGNYNQKMQVINAGGEDYDLVFTSHWTNNYYNNINQGALLPLNDLLQKYAPNIMKVIPQGGWDSVKVNGKIYGIPNYQIWAYTNVVSVRTDLAAKYAFDPASVKNLKDLEPFLANIKKNEPDLFPMQNSKAGFLPGLLAHYGFDEIAGRNIPGVIRLKDNSLKVENQFESPEFKEEFATMRDFYTKGYFRKDVATLADTTPDNTAGKYAVLGGGGTYAPGMEVGIMAKNNGNDFTVVKISDSYLETSGITATMTGINAKSKNPERAMMFYDMLFSDKQLYNLLAHGIEGKHYTKIDEDTVEPIKDGGYDPNVDWQLGDQFNGYYRKGQAKGIWDNTIKLNETAIKSPLLGFTFDPTQVKAELAQCNAIQAQYMAILDTGSVDPDKVLPEFIDKLKKAGSDKIIAEEQKQIDAWKAASGK
jgi:putative aldouronate transport system substrate-binding protein